MSNIKSPVETRRDTAVIDFTIGTRRDERSADAWPDPAHPQAFQRAMEIIERTVYGAD